MKFDWDASVLVGMREVISLSLSLSLSLSSVLLFHYNLIYFYFLPTQLSVLSIFNFFFPSNFFSIPSYAFFRSYFFV